MLTYYLALARRNLRRHPSLTALMILAIAFGVGASMTTLTVLRALSADPLPGASEAVYRVQIDARALADYVPGVEPSDQLTRADAEALVRAAGADRQALTRGGTAAILPERAGADPAFVPARWASADFFALFRAPFLAGGAWTADDDARRARVAVISRGLAERAFGTTAAVGKTLHVGDHALRVIGVLDHWKLTPRVYDLSSGAYAPTEDLFAPFSTSRELRLPHAGSMSCWGEVVDRHAVDATCEWIQLWVELATPARAAAYRELLVRYAEDQRARGRFQRPPNVRLRAIPQWLAHHEVVPRDVRLQTWVALGFLVVCLVNTVGLLLTKFMRRAAELGVRRALGASRRAIFAQLLVEAGMIGVAGGAVGLGLAWLGLAAVRQQPTPYAQLAQLDVTMLVATIALALLASLLAGLLPAWRGCQLAPATQLKSH
jgi:putative ABC transport system permease protein